MFTTHDPDHAFRVATKVLLMQPDQVAAVGTPDAVLAPDSLAVTYGRPVRVLDVEGRGVCVATGRKRTVRSGEESCGNRLGYFSGLADRTAIQTPCRFAN